jgi:sugar lactone lactonase YvrE
VSNHRVRRLSPSGDVVTMAGDGTAGYRDGNGVQARFNFPIGVFVDQGGDIYVADAENNRIRKISPAGFRNVSTVAGSGSPGYVNGPALEAQFNFPNDLVVNAAGDIFVTEFNNHTVRRVTPGGDVITWAGNGAAGYADGPPGQSRLNRPGGIAIDRAGNLYVTEWGNHRVRRIDPAGNVITLAGSGIAGYADGPALQARFNAPDGIAVDTYGNVYVTESANFVVRRIANGEVVTVAGGTEGGYRDGYGTAARFGGGGNGPGGLGIDPQGNLLVADSTSQMIRKISLVVTPRLSLTPGADGLELSWPATSAGFVLESAARLEPPATWSVLPLGTQAPGATIAVRLPRENVQRYYRLRRP